MLKKLIPTKYHYLLSDIKNSLFGGYRKSYYSQFGEDVVLSKIFSKKDGFYVDVGAHHPQRYSNTYLLYKKGWRGVNIDPNPYTINLFAKARPNDTNVCCGVGKEDGTLQYYQFSDPAINTFSEEQAKQWMGKNWVSFLGTKPIRIRTLSEVLSDMPKLPPIDVLNIDTEGMDLEVLEHNDWSRFQPQVIVVETSGFDPNVPAKSPVYSFLASQHYRLRAFMEKSLIFEKEA